jgi:hypothetical protein
VEDIIATEHLIAEINCITALVKISLVKLVNN